MVDPITVDNFSFPFNCTSKGLTSDTMTVDTLDLHVSLDEGFGCDVASLVRPTEFFFLFRYSVVCTIESVSLLYLLFIS